MPRARVWVCWLLMKRVPGEGRRPSAFPSVFPSSVKGGSSAVHPGRFLLFRLLLFHSVPLRPCDGPKSERSFGARKGKEGAATDDPEGTLNFFKLQPSQAQGAGRSWPAPTACPLVTVTLSSSGLIRASGDQIHHVTRQVL